MIGRNVAFDEEARAKFFEAMVDGCIDAECCARAGITAATMYWWLDGGRRRDGTAYGRPIARAETLQAMIEFSEEFSRIDPLRRAVRREKMHADFLAQKEKGFNKIETTTFTDGDGNVDKVVTKVINSKFSEDGWKWYLKTQDREHFDDRHSIVIEGADLTKEEQERVAALVAAGKVGISDQGAIREGNISVARRVLREHELEG